MSLLTLENDLKLFVSTLKENLKIDDNLLIQALQSLTLSSLLSKKAPINKTENKADTKTCIAILKSGERQGQLCGKVVSSKSVSGQYCGFHVRIEQTEQSDQTKSENTNGVIFRINKHGRFSFGESGLILMNEDELKMIAHVLPADIKTVILGKQLLSGEIIDLTQEDRDLCDMRGIRYIIYSEFKQKI